MNLSQMLREGTMDAHRAVEQSSFVRAFMQGTITQSLYARHLALLKRVYDSLELSLQQNASHPHVSPIVFPELNRGAALEQDLKFFSWADDAAGPGTASYEARIREVSRENPKLLAAHSYVRYLGDLSGGQILKKVAARSLGLDGGGLSFYDFPAIADIPAFKTGYRDALDSLPLSMEEKEEMTREARHAFALNAGLFMDLENDPAFAAKTGNAN